MISTAAGPRLPHCLLSGTVYELDDELGAELVKERAAEEVANPARKPVETAALDAGEKAIADGSEEKSQKTGEDKASLMAKLTSPKKNEKSENADKPAAQKAAKK